jgi:hypothetical protein
MADAADTDSAPAAPGVGPDAEEARGWTGHRLDVLGGSGVARIDGYYADAETGRPEWLVAKLGRFGQSTLVPARDAVGAAGKVWVPYSLEIVKAAPRRKAKQPLTRQAELELLEHFGIGKEAGRAAELDARGPDAVTASLAP